MNAPLLELRDVRIDVGPRLLVEQVNFCSNASRLGLLGRGRAIFDVLSGTAQVTEGTLYVAGVDYEEALSSHLYACACPWPSPSPNAKRFGMTILDGLAYSSMLGGDRPADAMRRSNEALSRLGLGHLGKQRLDAPVGLLHYLAGLAEAALFEPEVVVVDWPIAALTAEGWARYGTALSLLLGRRRFIAWVNGSAQLAVERAWLLALDELLHLDGEVTLAVPTGGAHFVRTLLVVAADAKDIEEAAEQSGLALTPVALNSSPGAARAAFVTELDLDEFGRPRTETIFAWCDEQKLPIVRLEPLGGVC